MTTFDTASRPSVRRGGRHPVNVGHFVMGIAFVGIVVVWILIEADAVTGDDIRWLLPVPWVLAGFAGLLATTRRRRDSEEWREAAYVASERGWVGREAVPPMEEPPAAGPVLDDLDEKLARAERETLTRQAPTPAADPPDPVDPADPADPTDPADPADPVDPADPADQKENDR